MLRKSLYRRLNNFYWQIKESKEKRTVQTMTERRFKEQNYSRNKSQHRQTHHQNPHNLKKNLKRATMDLMIPRKTNPRTQTKLPSVQ